MVSFKKMQEMSLWKNKWKNKPEAEEVQMKVLLRKIRTFIISLKLISIRMSSYITLINVGMILFLTLSQLNERYGFNIDLGKYLAPIYGGVLLAIFLIGYVEMYILKGMHEEQKIQFDLMPIHPELQDMKRKVDEMYEKQKEKI